MQDFFPLQKIAIVATASVSPEFEVKEAGRILPEKLGVPVVFSSECYVSPKSAQEKSENFLAYCLDDSVSHLWSCRGGEGSCDIIPYLVKALPELKKAKPKMLIGFSDFTAILVFFAQKLNWPAVHGMGALQFVRKFPDDLTIQKTIDLVKSGKYSNSFDRNYLTALNQAAQNSQKITGKLIGGNLTLLSISIKDQWEVETDGKIVFLEDWHEKGYQVNRTLKYLNRIGKFEKIKALILGDFWAGELAPEPDQNKIQGEILMRALKDFAEKLEIPVFYTPRIGHGLSNDPLILEREIEI